MSLRGARDLLVLLTPCFVLIAAVWLLRLVLGMARVPVGVVQFVSLNGAAPLAVIVATLLLHSRGRAGYRRIFLSSFLLVAWTQVLILAAIVFSLLTGWENVYTVSEFSVPNDPYHRAHILGHLVAILFGGLIGGVVGSVVLWLLRRIDAAEA